MCFTPVIEVKDLTGDTIISSVPDNANDHTRIQLGERRGPRAPLWIWLLLAEPGIPLCRAAVSTMAAHLAPHGTWREQAVFPTTVVQNKAEPRAKHSMPLATGTSQRRTGALTLLCSGPMCVASISLLSLSSAHHPEGTLQEDGRGWGGLDGCSPLACACASHY